MASSLEIILPSDEEEEVEELNDFFISEKLYYKERQKMENDTGFDASLMFFFCSFLNCK